ncbi:hypothetical protein PERCYII10_4381 [Pseudomonas aeruginosa]|nr:hypothetical protein PERCYII10_4381 [Pseudomonas aeruginosa]
MGALPIFPGLYAVKPENRKPLALVGVRGFCIGIWSGRRESNPLSMSSISVLCILMLAQEGCYLLIKAHFVSLVSTFFRQFLGGAVGGSALQYHYATMSLLPFWQKELLRG